MELKVKFLEWSAGIPVAGLNLKTAEKLGIHIGDRIFVKTLSSPKKEMNLIVDIMGKIVGKDEIIVSSETKKRMNLHSGQKLDVSISSPLKSLTLIKKKLNDGPLSEKEINQIIEDIVNNSLSEADIALFITTMYKQGMNFKETIFLIKAILKSGSKLDIKNKFIVDKHCIGGIPGNRTTPLVVSICAAAGLVFPKTSSRAITSAAGTADVIEAIAQIEFSMDEVKKILKKTNACMVWGGGVDLAPADDKIIQVEKMLEIDPQAQLLASIMAKKISVGSNYILLDIPYGKTAKATKEKAIDLKRKFNRLGKYFKKHIECVLTDGSQPIGNGIGPILELIDIIKILDPKQIGPRDLEQKSLFLAGQIFEMTGKAKKNKGTEMAKRILCSGKAFEKFKQIIEAQNGKIKNLEPAKFKRDILAKKSGTILRIDNKKINFLARAAGCPVDKASGLYLHYHVGGKVKRQDKILTIYANSRARLNQALKFYKNSKPIEIK
jgi:putative thymidine phosphorylase